MPPTSCPRLRDARALAALGLAAGITVPAALWAARRSPPCSAASVPAASAADRQPVCGDPDAKDFPIETRIQDAPDRYASGGGYGTWFLDLTNTTDTPCRALHPVLVLADRDRRLTSDQIQLEFSEPGRPDVEHRVTWEGTDRDEQIGVFGGGADGGREKAEGGEDGEAGTSNGTGTGTGTGKGTGTGIGKGTDADSSGTDRSADEFLGFTVPMRRNGLRTRPDGLHLRHRPRSGHRPRRRRPAPPPGQGQGRRARGRRMGGGVGGLRLRDRRRRHGRHP